MLIQNFECFEQLSIGKYDIKIKYVCKNEKL